MQFGVPARANNDQRRILSSPSEGNTTLRGQPWLGEMSIEIYTHDEDTDMKRDTVIEVLRSNQEDLRHRFGVTAIRLFGSVARDEAGDTSDVDIIVEFDSTPSLFDFLRLKGYLQDLLGTRVDLSTANGLRQRAQLTFERDAIHVA